MSEIDDLRAVATRLGPRTDVPTILAEWYPQALANYDARYSLELRKAGCELMLVGASDRPIVTEDGTPYGNLCQADGVVIRMPQPGQLASSPDPFGNWHASIGCGSAVPEYVENIREPLGQALLQMFDTGPVRDMAQLAHLMMGVVMSAAVDRAPTEGVGGGFVGAIVTPEGTMFGPNSIVMMNGEPVQNQGIPLAASWRELIGLLKRFGVCEADAVVFS